MAQGFCHRQVGVMELNIFSYQTNGNGFAAVIDFLYKLFPFCQIRIVCLDSQFPTDDPGKVLLFQHQRCFIQDWNGDVFNDAVRLNIAEHTDFLENAVLQGLITAQNDNIRFDTHTLQLPDGVLGGFGFMFLGATEEGNQSYMDKEAVFFSYL